VNVIFLLVKIIKYGSSTYTIWSYIGIVLLLGLNWFCYTNILESAASSTGHSKDLVGGARLDVIAVVWLVQAGTLLWSPQVYYVLSVFPCVEAYKLLHTLKGGGGGSSTPSPQGMPSDISERAQGRRQAQAEENDNENVSNTGFSMMGLNSEKNRTIRRATNSICQKASPPNSVLTCRLCASIVHWPVSHTM
jgi:hypothetical protein